jgi:hypothetical protein
VTDAASRTTGSKPDQRSACRLHEIPNQLLHEKEAEHRHDDDHDETHPLTFEEIASRQADGREHRQEPNQISGNTFLWKVVEPEEIFTIAPDSSGCPSLHVGHE